MSGRTEAFRHPSTRREFLRITAAASAATSLSGPIVSGQEDARKVFLVCDKADPLLGERPVQWAIGELEASLKSRGLPSERRGSLNGIPAGAVVLVVAGLGSKMAQQAISRAGEPIPAGAETLALVRTALEGREVVLLSGADTRGLVYAILEAADRVRYVPDPLADLKRINRVVERPANAIRSIARLFTSDVEDKPWFYDKLFWHRYLSMLVGERFNRFNLTLGLGYNSPRRVPDSYFYFAYPFLVAVPGYQVRAKGLPEDERERNLAVLRWISEETAGRGLHFQLALWTHAYEFQDSPNVNYPIVGLTPQSHAAYCRDALHQLLDACPAISGVTFRGHSESGVPEGSYEFWRTVFEGVARVSRKVEIDIHSKGIEHRLLDLALATGQPVNVSPKYWAEHMGLPYHQAAIRSLEWQKPEPGSTAKIEQERRFTRYGYGDYLREDRRYGVLWRIWPGTQRLLLWGDPVLAAGYGRFAHFCSSQGLELCEPLSFKGRMGSGQQGSRDAYADESLRPGGGDWEKYLCTYRLWGRLLYNPDSPRDSWGRLLGSQFGRAAGSCQAALSAASRVLPLVTTAHHPSASNNAYWPEIYTNMPIVDADRPHPYGDTPSPKRFGTVSPLDPAMFSSVEEFAEELVSGRRTGKYSPLDVARWLQEMANQADAGVAAAKTRIARPEDPPFRRLAIDVAIQSGLGRFFAEKLRAAVAFALFEKTGEPGAIEEAVKHYRAARDAWAGLAKEAKQIYVDDITFGTSLHLRGHWADRLAAIEADLGDMEAKRQGAATEQSQRPRSRAASPAYLADLSGTERNLPRCLHLPLASFRQGEPIEVEMAPEAGYSLESARLHYRRVNQADEYQVVEMAESNGRWKAVIPGDYTDSPYPLMYYFQVRDPKGEVSLWPGLNEDLANQPYYVVRQA